MFWVENLQPSEKGLTYGCTKSNLRAFRSRNHLALETHSWPQIEAVPTINTVQRHILAKTAHGKSYLHIVTIQ